MEIEPEVLPPKGRPSPSSGNMPGKWKMMALGLVAIVVGGLLLYVMFWAALFFVALGLITLGINVIRSWFRGDQPTQNSQTRVKFYINRSPPEE